MESTHSSNVSGGRHGQAKNGVVIPPDALYTPSTRKQQHFQTLPNNHSFQNNQDFHQKHHVQYSGYDPATGAVFNDCKVRLHHQHHHPHTLQRHFQAPHHIELSQHNHELHHFNTIMRRNNY